jgi:hypothetical protein
MGLLNLVKTAQSGAFQTGQTTITTDLILGIDSQAITPTNPKEFGIHRTAPILEKPRSFSVAEANALDVHAKKRTIQANATEKATDSLIEIKNADTKEQIAFNRYRVHEAKKTYKQVESNAHAGNQIANLAPKYNHLHESVKHRLNVIKAQNEAINGKAEEFKKLW